MNASLNRQWRRTIRDMSSPQIAEAMACLDPAGSPGRQRPMSASAAVRILLWVVQSLPRREASDKRLRSLASQRMTGIASALARTELPEHVLRSIDADLHCANQALRELLGASAKPIVLRQSGQRDERTPEAPPPAGSHLKATSQSPDAYRIMHDLTIAYGLYVVIALLIGLVIITMVASWITKRVPPTPVGLMQGWERAAQLLDDPTSLMLPVTTLIIGMLSIPILTEDGRSASLEDRGRQLFLNRVIHIASPTVAVLSVLTMLRPSGTETPLRFTAQGIISGVTIALLALLPPTLTKFVVDESHRLLQSAEATIEGIDAMTSGGHLPPNEPARPTHTKDRMRLLRRVFLIIFVVTVTIILCSATARVHDLNHSALGTAAYPLVSLTVLLFLLAYSVKNLMQAGLLHEIYADKLPRRAAARVQTILLTTLTSFFICSPIALTKHSFWFPVSFVLLLASQIAFSFFFRHLLPEKASKMKKRFLAHQRALNERTIEAERKRLGNQAA